MNITDFTIDHINAAMVIAKENYEEERAQVPVLPGIQELPDLAEFVEYGLGVSAFENDRMVGYLCAWPPRRDAFGTTGVSGTFVPIHAHGVAHDITGSGRERIYSRMYQAAAEKWVKKGILSHGISLYTHDTAAIKSFFYNGFGLRCIDAIRTLEELPVREVILPGQGKTLDYVEIPRNEWVLLLEHHKALIAHLGRSPIFMTFPTMAIEDLYDRTNEDTRYFTAKADSQYIAYIKLDQEGETFVSDDHSMMNINGAYCLPEYRGLGIYQNLLSFMISTLREEGYTRLGVDCESFNPTARGFWLKHFTEYTHSVVRRIDDKAISAMNSNNYE